MCIARNFDEACAHNYIKEVTHPHNGRKFTVIMLDKWNTQFMGYGLHQAGDKFVYRSKQTGILTFDKKTLLVFSAEKKLLAVIGPKMREMFISMLVDQCGGSETQSLFMENDELAHFKHIWNNEQVADRYVVHSWNGGFAGNEYCTMRGEDYAGDLVVNVWNACGEQRGYAFGYNTISDDVNVTLVDNDAHPMGSAWCVIHYVAGNATLEDCCILPGDVSDIITEIAEAIS